MATKFTYKMRSGGNGMWGRGPAQRKQSLKKKIFQLLEMEYYSVSEPLENNVQFIFF